MKRKEINYQLLIRRICLIVLDIICIIAASILALLTRFEFDFSQIPKEFLKVIYKYGPFTIVITLIIFSLFRIYSSLWEYAGIEEVFSLIAACLVAAVAKIVIILFTWSVMPRSWYVLDTIYLMILIGATRVSYRLIRLRRQNRTFPWSKRKKVMIIGGGEAGRSLITEIQNSKYLDQKVVCIIDDDPYKIGRYIKGVKVVGNRNSIKKSVKKYNVQQIILTIPSANAAKIRPIVEICQDTNCELMILPGVYQLVNGEVKASKLRPVNIDDLLGRDELEIPVKARLDGEYVKKMGPLMDIRCFIGTVFSVLRSDGVVEGGTGAKKKLMVITNHSYMLWQFRRELIGKLMEDYDVIISTPFVGHEDDFAAMGCTMIETDVDRRGINPKTDMKLYLTYRRLLKEHHPDMVVTYSIKPNVYAGYACRQMRIPYCVNVQGLGTAFQKKGLREIVIRMYKIALKKAKTVYFENKGNAKVFLQEQIIRREQMCLLKGAGVNLKYYTYQKYPENDKVHFLYLGRIMKEKGMDELFYAAKELQRKEVPFVLDLVGFFEDEYKEKIDKLVDAKIAVFHGFQEDPRPYYAMADCVVLPSYHEGMSNVLLEAAATGRPVITSNIPGCKEAVDDDKSGLLCEAEDWNDLYRKMSKIAQMSRIERETMGVCGRDKMAREFDKDKVVKKTIQGIERV